MTADLTQLSQLLSRAADHIAAVGLNKGTFCGLKPNQTSDSPIDERPTDAAGAIAWAHTGWPVPCRDDVLVEAAIRFVSGHLKDEPPTDFETGRPEFLEHVASWVDREERTEAEAVELLRRCARDAAECELLCRHIAEYDGHEAHDWGPKELDAYKAELAQLRIEAAA